MKRPGSAYMSGIAAAAGPRPGSTKVLRPPFRLYGAQRVLVGERTTIAPQTRPPIASAPETAASAGIKPPVTSPVAAGPRPSNSPSSTTTPATTKAPAAGAVTTRGMTETVPAPTQPLTAEEVTRPTLVRAEVRGEETPVSPPAPALQPPPERQPPAPVAPIRGSEPADRPRIPADELAATVVQANLTPSDKQPPSTESARESRALTPEPSSTIAIGPRATSQTVSPTPARPSTRQPEAPSVQIGVIDVTVLPSPAPPIPIAPQAPSAGPAAVSAPLSRGVGSWYGLAQR
jgi:hypothetical protein